MVPDAGAGFGLITYGLALPSGLFVPCIMSGAALGRLVGETLGMTSLQTSPGNFALIGAAGMLGGVCRMTISITVIVVESTGNVSAPRRERGRMARAHGAGTSRAHTLHAHALCSHAPPSSRPFLKHVSARRAQVTFMLPIAITIMLAKLVGDTFTEGIYDLHIHIKRYPFLPDEPAPERTRLQASDVMEPSVRTVCELEQVSGAARLHLPCVTTPRHISLKLPRTSQDLAQPRPTSPNLGPSSLVLAQYRPISPNLSVPR